MIRFVMHILFGIGMFHAVWEVPFGWITFFLICIGLNQFLDAFIVLMAGLGRIGTLT